MKNQKPKTQKPRTMKEFAGNLRESALKNQKSNLKRIYELLSKEARITVPNKESEMLFRLRKSVESMPSTSGVTFTLSEDRDNMYFFFANGVDGGAIMKSDSVAVVVTMPGEKRAEIPLYKIKEMPKAAIRTLAEEKPADKATNKPKSTKIRMADVVKPKGVKKEFVPNYTSEAKDEKLGVIIGKEGEKGTRYLPFKTPLAQMNPGILKMQITRIKGELLEGEHILNTNIDNPPMQTPKKK